jgi:ATP-dependent Clp protease ATP-binding subunit ClpC
LFERFTDRAKKALSHAQEIAKSYSHNYIGTEHLLLGVLRENEGIGAKVLIDAGFTFEVAEKKIQEVVPPGDTVVRGPIPFTQRAKKVFEFALREALQIGHNYVGTEHIVLGLIREGETSIAEILTESGINLETTRNAVLEEISKRDGTGSGKNANNSPEGADSQGEENAEAAEMGFPMGGRRGKPAGSSLENYGSDLSKKAEEGLLDPVIGREQEIDRMVETLARRTKNNPILIGEPGVGKTAVVEGLAQAIYEERVPNSLKGLRVFNLDLAAMLAGAKYRGEFEERLKKTLREVQKRGNVIVFIDELHTIIGAGSSEGAVDAANIVKPLLARGELRMVGATTINEYRKHVEKDAALARRFQTIMIEAPNVEDTMSIMKGLRENFAEHHGVEISDEALLSATMLSDRYISDRFLPDKAIDLVDEAAARLRLTEAKSEQAGYISEQAIEQKKADLQGAVEAEDKEAALDLEREIAEMEEVKKRQDADGQDLPRLDSTHIAFVLSRKTGIPVSHLTAEETTRLMSMENELSESVIGQTEAVNALSRTIRRTHAGLKDPKRPSGSFIFAGPSGVGKTELSKALAKFLFGDEDSLITLDMSEYSEKHNVSRLFGAPPGYVGFEDGGQLTEQVRRKPYSVILFDEVEKAHPEVFNTLLQVLDEGRLTDSQGRIVDFKNTVIIMTTNLGSRDIGKGQALGFVVNDHQEDYARMQAMVGEELKKNFRPEFLNRVDETIVFQPLQEKEIIKIADLIINAVQARLRDRNIELEVTDEAKSKLAELGYDKALGARPLRRVIQRHIEDALSEKILFGDVLAGETATIGVQADNFEYKSRKSKKPRKAANDKAPTQK